MSFLSELKKRQDSLNHTSTRVTTVDGKVYVEELLNGEQLSHELLTGGAYCPGYVVDVEPDLQVAEILTSALYLGSQDVTQDEEIIKHHRISHILSLGVPVPHLTQLPNLSYTFIPALDLPDEKLDSILNKALPLMEDSLSKGERLFVHCNAGISRSPTVVIAYLMANRGLSYCAANILVKQRRPSSNPNAGFVKQLQAFERKLIDDKMEKI